MGPAANRKHADVALALRSHNRHGSWLAALLGIDLTVLCGNQVDNNPSLRLSPKRVWLGVSTVVGKFADVQLLRMVAGRKRPQRAGFRGGGN